jgi:hypothetical protein
MKKANCIFCSSLFFAAKKMDKIKNMANRPTILIGYGTFGLNVLRRLLASTVLRGILSWEKQNNTGNYIKNLALFWVKDINNKDDGDIDDGISLEMMRDLFSQIQTVKPDDSGLELASSINKVVKNRLLADNADSNNENLPLGLDIFVIMQPTTLGDVAHLNRLLRPTMQTLANYNNLQQTDYALNFIQIVGFENYWDDSENGKNVRMAMHQTVQNWQQITPNFERFYFVDGCTRDAIRLESQRIDEISLFLEFLLFEKQRIGPFTNLYKSQDYQSPIATFGIRLVERSSDIFSRLAAAIWTIGWIDYLLGVENIGINTEPSKLKAKLDLYRPARLEKELGEENLWALLNDKFRDLEQNLVKLGIADNWPQEVRKRYEETVQELETLLTAEVHQRFNEVTNNYLNNLANDLQEGITDDLHNISDPVTLGAVIREINNTSDTLDIPAKNTDIFPINETNEVLKSATEIYAEYATFNKERLKIESFKWWQLIFPLAVTIGLTPIIIDLLSSITNTTLQILNNPIGIGTLIFLITFGMSWIFHKSIHKRLKQARKYWTHPNKGRFINYVRHILQPNEVLRKPSEDFLKRLLNDMALTIRVEVMHHLNQVKFNLQEREREMQWLQEQLRDFLRMHGIDAEGNPSSQVSNVRHSMEQLKNIDYRLGFYPAIPERFRSAQSEKQPFSNWNKRYNDKFLYTLKFIDELRNLFEGPPLNEDQIAKNFIAFLEQHGNFSPAFSWPAQEGVPPNQSFCLLPQSWNRLGGITAAMSNIGITQTNIHPNPDESRAYLLNIQIGVDYECLLTIPERAALL